MSTSRPRHRRAPEPPIMFILWTSVIAVGLAVMITSGVLGR